jgi:thioredoxin-dependent peroxiredoxin
MIDPPKATKGRRMSKKTRKKSPKTATGKAARAGSGTSVKTAATKAPKASPAKSGKKAVKKAVKPVAKPASKVSAKAPSKPLKAPGRIAAAPRSTAAAKAATAKPAAAPASKPPSNQQTKPLQEQTGAPAAGKSGLVEGAKAPAFRLPRDGGETVALSDFAGKKLVLFFYPRADTPGCTKEAIDFTRLAGAFAEHQTAVLGVSADPQKAQEAFRDKHQLATPLVSDEAHGMLEAYGVWGEKSMYGRTFQGIIRTTVLIGADGRIKRIWRNVKVDGHADEVLAAVAAE